MTEKVEEKEEEPEVEEEVKEEVVEPTETVSIEDIAKKIGWNPNHDGSDGRPKLSAEEFILKSKEIQSTSSKQIKKQSREITELKNGLKALEEHNKAVYNAQVALLKREVAELKARRKEAVADGDSVLVGELDGQIKEMSEIPTKLPETSSELHPDFVSWVDDNDWYENDQELRIYADMLGEQPEYRVVGQKNYKQFLEKIEGTVKKMFPQKFETREPEPKTRQAAPVERPTRGPQIHKTKLQYKDLTRQQQDLADFYEKQGVMTKEKYIEQLETIQAAS